MSPFSPVSLPLGSSRTAAMLIVAPVFLAMVVVLQWSGGAYAAEFGGHPDEAAHYVTGLLIRDYVAAGVPGNPMAFAERYYNHYPKVALGNWPPVFYIVQAGWTLLFSPGRVAVLLLMALLTTMAALVVVHTLADEVGFRRALLGGALFVAFPLVQQHAGMIMTEIPVALFSSLAVLHFGRYLDRGRTADSVLFGLWASAAIMTKGSGMVLAIVPPLAVVFSGTFGVLARPNFWYPAVIVAVLCGPWTWAFRDIARAGWMESAVSLTYVRTAMVHFPRELLTSASLLVTGLALVGIGAALTAVRRQRASRTWAAAAALVVGLLVFHGVVPASLDSRHLVQALPAWAMFGVAGVAFLERRWAAATRQPLRWLPWGVAVAGVLHTGWSVPDKVSDGFAPVVTEVVADPDNTAAVFLISSDATGEGMFIAETAMREARPGHVIRRASKVLATQAWSGRDYEAVVHTAADLLTLLEREGIDFVLVDASIPSALVMPHHRLVQSAVAEYPGHFQLRRTYPVRRPGVSLPAGISLYEMSYTAAAVSTSRGWRARAGRTVSPPLRSQ